jgi:hypothetical protein
MNASDLKGRLHFLFGNYGFSIRENEKSSVIIRV